MSESERMEERDAAWAADDAYLQRDERFGWSPRLKLTLIPCPNCGGEGYGCRKCDGAGVWYEEPERQGDNDGD